MGSSSKRADDLKRFGRVVRSLEVRIAHMYGAKRAEADELLKQSRLFLAHTKEVDELNTKFETFWAIVWAPIDQLEAEIAKVKSSGAEG